MYASFLNIIDIVRTFAFAVSGVFSAMQKKPDPFGILIISFLTAIGRGTVRDPLVVPGTISACFGGVPRALLLNKVRLIFQKEICALAYIGGGITYFFYTHKFERRRIKNHLHSSHFCHTYYCSSFQFYLPRVTLK